MKPAVQELKAMQQKLSIRCVEQAKIRMNQENCSTFSVSAVTEQEGGLMDQEFDFAQS